MTKMKTTHIRSGLHSDHSLCGRSGRPWPKGMPCGPLCRKCESIANKRYGGIDNLVWGMRAQQEIEWQLKTMRAVA